MGQCRKAKSVIHRKLHIAEAIPPVFTFLYLILLPFLSGCSDDNLSPNQFPFRLERVHETRDELYAHDLNNDGRDELVILGKRGSIPERERESVHLALQDGPLIEQLNFVGSIKSPHFLDWDSDGVFELIIPFIRDDSMFVCFANAAGKKLFSFFLIDGKPRIEENSVFPWDPLIRDFHLQDVNQDGRLELVTVIFTSFARLPRGLLIHSLPDGKELGESIIGAAVLGSFLDDFDKDGRQEILTYSAATNNGANVGGFTDAKAYIIRHNLSLPLDVTWSKEIGELWAFSRLFYDDFDADGKREFLTFTYNNFKGTDLTKLELVDPISWRVILRRTINEKISLACLIDVDRDLVPEILTLKMPDEFILFDRNLNVLKRKKFQQQVWQLAAMPDIDSDGYQEIAVYTTDMFYLLQPNLEIKAGLAIDDVEFQNDTPFKVLRRGAGQWSDIIMNGKEKTIQARQVKNPHYLMYRYGPAVGWFLLFALMAALPLALLFLFRRVTLWQKIQHLSFTADDIGLMIIDRTGHLLRLDGKLFDRLGLDTEQKIKRHKFRDVFANKELVVFLSNLAQGPYQRQEKRIELDRHHSSRYLHVFAEPLHTKPQRKSRWLLIFRDISIMRERERANTWARMAQRVAHDIRNPLTSLQLTFQQFLSEVESSPEKREKVAIMAERMIARIEDVRRMTSNFMKFVDIEEADLQDISSIEFITAEYEKIKENLPPDIQLRLMLDNNDAVVKLDTEQFHVMFDNLVTNAINAMPDGGTITISTSIAKGLYLPPQYQSERDFVVLEIRDTGKGMTSDMLAKIFQPDFSSREPGTGLGLAIVRKVIENHHAHIEFDSEPGVGTSCFLYIPCFTR